MEGLLQPTHLFFFFILLIPLMIAGGACIVFLAARAKRRPASETKETPARRLNMPDETDRQAVLDEEHLKLLSWGYYISAGVAAAFSMLGLFYIAMGFVMGAAFSKAAQSASKSDQFPAEFPIWFFGLFGLAIFLAMTTAAVLKFVTARKIRARKSKIFCMVIAALSCLEFPYGMALGIVTFVLLSRPSVARRFEAGNVTGEKS